MLLPLIRAFSLEYKHAFFAWSTGELGSHDMLYVVDKQLNYNEIAAIPRTDFVKVRLVNLL